MNKMTKARFPHSFGVFSPTGYVVMAFADGANANQARQALLQNGFSENDVTQYSKDEVMAEFQESETHADEPTQIGQDVAKVDTYIDLCKQGCAFLVLHSPEEQQAKRAVELARPFKLRFAEKYNRLTLEELA